MFGLIDMKDGTNAPFLTHFYEGGLFPNGVTALLITMITVNFSFQGTELIGIAAGRVKILKRLSLNLLSKLFGVRCSSLCYPYLYLQNDTNG